jgi:hypothetical protein
MITIHPSVLVKPYTRTPAAITAAIRHLCQEISPDYEPRFVEISPEPGSKPNECFSNVETKIKDDGGELVYGWAIWEWPRVFVEAEHHAVWRNGGGLVDVTPHVPLSERILFLPDP